MEPGHDDDLACLELVEIITAYLDGALSDAERARFEAHLAVCEGCRRYLDQMRTTIRLAGALPEEGLDPAAKDQLLRLFRDWTRV